MQLRVKGKNLEVSDSIREHTERKLVKLERMLDPLTEVEVELALEKNPSIAANQVAEATVWMKGHTLRARESAPDMKAAVDAMSETLMRQVADDRKKRETKRRTPAPAE
jgi:putative sigma-54 modulation protein